MTKTMAAKKPKKKGGIPVEALLNAYEKAKEASVDLTREQQVEAVIARIEAGESERSSCEAVGISRSTFRTMAMRIGAGDQYARALEALAHDQAEKMELTIEDMRSGKIDAQMARVEIDARKWFASKFLPKRYGDKIEIAGDPNAPLKQEISSIQLVPLSASTQD